MGAIDIKRILIYLAITFTLTWTLWFSAAPATIEGTSMGSLLPVALGMFCPAIGAALTWAVCRKTKSFSLHVKPRLRGNIRWYLLALYTPAILAATGAALYFLIWRDHFDPSFGYIREALEALGNDAVDISAQTAAAQLLFAVTIAPFINLLFGFGEELGWRGLLYPALRERFSPAITCVASGVIWGLWHAPITMRGHNYGFGYPGFPVTGVLAMCLFCVTIGTLLHWITEKTGSVWPAALAHGALNAVAGIPLLLLPSAETGLRVFGPTMPGMLSGIPLALAAIWCVFHLKKNEAS